MKTRPVINKLRVFSAGGEELYSLVLTGIAALKEGKNSFSSTEEMMRTVEDINEMVKENSWKIYNESIDVSEALVYLKLNEHILRKQGSLNEVRGFLPVPRNGKEKHMTHPRVKGPHNAKELKILDEDSTDIKKKDWNPWILKYEPEDPQIIQ